MFGMLTAPRPYDGTFEDALAKSTDPNRRQYGDHLEPVYTVNDHSAAATANDSKFVLKGERPYAGEMKEMRALVSAGQEYRWTNLEGFELSNPFFIPSVPKRLTAVDVDNDGDEDIVVEYDNGAVEVSYNLCAQFRSGEIYVTGSQELRNEVKYWLNDNVPKLVKLLNHTSLAELFLMRSLPVQLYAELEKNLADDNITSPRQKIDSIEAVIARYTDKYGDLYDSTNPRTNNVLPTLDQVYRRMERDIVKRSFGLHHLGADISYANIASDLGAALGLTEDAQKEFAQIAGQAKRTIGIIGNNDGGIGLGYNPEDEKQGFIKVTQVNCESPAEKAGIKTGDRIVVVDGKTIEELRNREINRLHLLSLVATKDNPAPAYQYGAATRKAIRGPLHSKVKLTIRRGENVLDLVVPRDKNFAPIAFRNFE